MREREKLAESRRAAWERGGRPWLEGRSLLETGIKMVRRGGLPDKIGEG